MLNFLKIVFNNQKIWVAFKKNQNPKTFTYYKNNPLVKCFAPDSYFYFSFYIYQCYIVIYTAM